MKNKKLRERYPELSQSAIQRILEADRAAGYGPQGGRPNRTRFYLYLAQRKSDVQIRTVAVKAGKRFEIPRVKEVVLASADDPEIHVLDLAYQHLCGYSVDWSPEGIGPSKSWDYAGQWEAEAWKGKGLFKIHAPVVNPDILKRSRRFRWCAWSPGPVHILDYLKMYKEHPGIEFLSKQGLGHFSDKRSLLRKLKEDREFVRFFCGNAGAVRSEGYTVREIMHSFRNAVPLQKSRAQICARSRFRGERIPGAIDAEKALSYLESTGIRLSEYAEYIRNCAELGLELRDTKVSFPRQFRRRSRVVKDRIEVLQAERDAAQKQILNEQLRALAADWSWMEEIHGAFRVFIPRTVDEFRDEGAALKNCLGDHYAAKAARGEVLVGFVRKAEDPATPFVAVEYDLKKQRVSQCYGVQNSKPEPRVCDFVCSVFVSESQQRHEVAA